MNTNTWYFYDSIENENLYKYYLYSKSIYQSTFDKPLVTIDTNIKFYIKNKVTVSDDFVLYGELRLLKWMGYNNYGFDLISDRDLHSGF